MIIQFCGLPGSGKTTLANGVKKILVKKSCFVEIIDGDEYRKTICSDLGFSKTDREENIRRLSAIANNFSEQGMVALLTVVNPYEAARKAVAERYKKVFTVYIQCPLPVLIKRDPKGLYKRALLPVEHPQKINNLTGINDPFEEPVNPVLTIDTSSASINACCKKLAVFILDNFNKQALDC